MFRGQVYRWASIPLYRASIPLYTALVKDQSSFYEIRIKIKTYNRINRSAEHSKNIFRTSGVLHCWLLLKMSQSYKLLNKLCSEG